MNADLVSRALLLLLLLAFVAHRGYYTRKYRRGGDEPDGRQLGPAHMVANALNVVALIASLVYIIYPAALGWAALPLPAWSRWLGLGLALSGFGLLQWAHRALATNWSDAPRLLAGQTLTTSGPYRWVRHPIYSAFLIILSAPLFITGNALVGFAWLLGTALEVAARVRYEERLIADAFGDDYTNYARRTGRLLPNLSNADVS